ncbi:MAG: ABC transporter permease [Bacteroidetes bacterium GWF2_42_66]|nr:MAG: ABC transporter permease [Bacteroidetes bacterium GWA2_42_15]OFY02473.1 MAG: ABC transporter permease [Bacteroidetes bacterium GWE2_42_39]OFY41428.1 MAG: ABC transporter permease [Bacteroidetes bacterium GWF2_42_66]HBL75364.1 ABC transporter permease [Prolixibacteraceae bacterium]HCR90283.1 ABC transporter permease [Prolixibacteraceae bacterium]
MSLLIGSITIGIILSLLALGIFISFRIFDFPDITAEGAFTFGAATAASLIVAGMNPLLASLIAFIAGMAAGAVTGVIHTRFKINPLLAGILVMTALYSVNLHVMGRSNVPLLNKTTVFSWVESFSVWMSGADARTMVLGWDVAVKDLWLLLFCLIAIVIFCIILWWFFKTNIGTAMRATGDNDQMIRALGVNTKAMIIAGVALSNGFIALAGAMLAQYQGFADVQMGIGMMVWGLASVIIGEAIINDNSLGFVITGAVFGSVLFRLLVAIALRWGLNPNDLKIITALFVFIALILPGIMKNKKKFTFKRKIHA